MLKNLLNNTVYVKITKNQFWARHIENQKEAVVTAADAFTTKRLLVGEFSTAEKYLKGIMKTLHEEKLFSASPQVILHPMEMVEGGLSEIEERAMIELAMGAGARKVLIWLGHELSDQEALEYVKKG